ncbi:ATP-binding protein [Streptomyces sp. A73]|nr:ATP-binding protein [Streptomyces sp. A73]
MTVLLGPDHESLLVARSHDGLIDAGNSRYWISTQVEATLQRKLDQMSGGAIAICGPRGVGKSTLLKKACQGRLPSPEPHFHTIVQTPANYRPEEFLLSLFQSVCRDYLALYGCRPRAPFLFRSRARAAQRPRRLYYSARRWAQLLAGLGLVAPGHWPARRSMVRRPQSYVRGMNWPAHSQYAVDATSPQTASRTGPAAPAVRARSAPEAANGALVLATRSAGYLRQLLNIGPFAQHGYVAYTDARAYSDRPGRRYPRSLLPIFTSRAAVHGPNDLLHLQRRGEVIPRVRAT